MEFKPPEYLTMASNITTRQYTVREREVMMLKH